jgi:hypothetical protein
MTLNVYTPFDLFFHSHWFMEGQDGGPGLHYLLLIPLGLLALSRKRSYLAWLFLSVALISFVLTFRAGAYLRYLYPLLAPLVLAGAITLGLLRTGDRWLFRAIVAVLLVALVLNIYLLPSSGWSHRDFFVNLFNKKEKEANLVAVAPVQKLIAYLNQAHPGRPVALFGSPTIAGLRAEAYATGWHTWSYSRQLGMLRSPVAYGSLARSLGIAYFVAPRKDSGEAVSPPAVAAFLEQYTEPEYGVGAFEVRHLKRLDGNSFAQH